MDVVFVKTVRVGAEVARARFHQTQCRLRALFHDVAKLPGEDQLAGAGRAAGFDEQNSAAYRRPGETRRHTRHAGAHRDFAFKLLRAQNFLQIGRIDAYVLRFAFRDAHRGTATATADFAFQIAYTRFARVIPDERADGLVGDHALLIGETVRL